MEPQKRLEALRMLTRIYQLQLSHSCDTAYEAHYSSRRYPDEAYQAVRRGQWLNDETMYEFSVLMQQHAYCMNSHFFVQLKNRSFDNAIKWIEKVPAPPRKSLLLFPININNTHWVGCAVDFAQRAIVYSDSMGGLNKDIMSQVLDFIYAKQAELQRITGEAISGFLVFGRDTIMEVDATRVLRPSAAFQAERSAMREIVAGKPNEEELNPNRVLAVKFRLERELVEEEVGCNALLAYLYFAFDMPRQTNCDDCGVYTLYFLKFMIGVTPVAICAGPVKNEARYLLCNELASQSIFRFD